MAYSGRQPQAAGCWQPAASVWVPSAAVVAAAAVLLGMAARSRQHSNNLRCEIENLLGISIEIGLFVIRLETEGFN